MCLAVPARVERVDGDRAIVEAFGCREEVDVRLVPGVCAGEFVLVHVGFAIQRLQPSEADELTQMWASVVPAGPSAHGGPDAAGGEEAQGDGAE